MAKVVYLSHDQVLVWFFWYSPSYGKVFPPLELLSYSQWIQINQMELDLVPDYLIAIWSLATNGLRDYQLATTATSQARYLSTIFGPQASSTVVSST